MDGDSVVIALWMSPMLRPSWAFFVLNRGTALPVLLELSVCREALVLWLTGMCVCVCVCVCVFFFSCPKRDYELHGSPVASEFAFSRK